MTNEHVNEELAFLEANCLVDVSVAFCLEAIDANFEAVNIFGFSLQGRYRLCEMRVCEIDERETLFKARLRRSRQTRLRRHLVVGE